MRTVTGQFERLNQPGRMNIPPLHSEHTAASDSPAPKASISGVGHRARRCQFRAQRWLGQSLTEAA